MKPTNELSLEATAVEYSSNILSNKRKVYNQRDEKNYVCEERFSIQSTIPQNFVILKSEETKSKPYSLEAFIRFHTHNQIWKTPLVDESNKKHPYNIVIASLLAKIVLGVSVTGEGNFYQFNHFGEYRRVSGISNMIRDMIKKISYHAFRNNNQFMQDYFNCHFLHTMRSKIINENPELEKPIPWSDEKLFKMFDLPIDGLEVVLMKMKSTKSDYKIIAECRKLTEVKTEELKVNDSVYELIGEVLRNREVKFVRYEEVYECLSHLYDIDNEKVSRRNRISNRKLLSVFINEAKYLSVDAVKGVKNNKKGFYLKPLPKMNIIEQKVVSSHNIIDI